MTLYIHADTAKGTSLCRDGEVGKNTGHGSLGAMWLRVFGQPGRGRHSRPSQDFPSADLPPCPQKIRGHLRCGRCMSLLVQDLTIQVSEKPEQNIEFFLMTAT